MIIWKNKKNVRFGLEINGLIELSVPYSSLDGHVWAVSVCTHSMATIETSENNRKQQDFQKQYFISLITRKMDFIPMTTVETQCRIRLKANLKLYCVWLLLTITFCPMYFPYVVTVILYIYFHNQPVPSKDENAVIIFIQWARFKFLDKSHVYFCIQLSRFCVVIHSFIPATTANDLRLGRLSYPRFYPLLFCLSLLNSWVRASISLFEVEC